MDWKRHRMWIAAVVLVGMVGVTFWVFRTKTGDTLVPDEDRVTLPEIDREALTALEIRRPGEGEEPIRLVRGEGGWRIAAPIEAPAASTAVDTALDKLVELEVVGIAATRAEHHERLEVDEAHAVRVTARAGDDVVIDMHIGAYRGGNTLVRLEGEDRVLSMRGSIKFAFNKPLRDWRERTITDFASDEVRRASFLNEHGRFVFERGDEGWSQVLGEDEEPIEGFASSKVRSMVSSLSRLRAAGFAEVGVGAAEAGILPDGEEGAARVILVGGEGDEARTVTLEVGRATEGERSERYVRRAGDETIFTVSSFVSNRLVPDGNAFVQGEDDEADGPPPEMPQMDPNAMMGGGGMPGMPGMGGPGGGGEIPPEVMEQIRRQLEQQQGAPGGP